jgi:CBS domain-containing membrane protein
LTQHDESLVTKDAGESGTEGMTTEADRRLRWPNLATSRMDRGRLPTLAEYVGRMRGKPRSFVRPRTSALAVTFGATFAALFVISIPSLYGDPPVSTRLFLIGSFGASAALLYAAPRAEFAQPRNIVFGQLIAAFVGVTAYKLLGGNVGVAGGLGVATATLVMQATGCLHPPAGATALIAVLGPAQVHRLGYLFLATPVLVATLVVLVLGLALLNLTPDETRHYPVSWW